MTIILVMVTGLGTFLCVGLFSDFNQIRQLHANTYRFSSDFTLMILEAEGGMAPDLAPVEGLESFLETFEMQKALKMGFAYDPKNEVMQQVSLVRRIAQSFFGMSLESGADDLRTAFLEIRPSWKARMEQLQETIEMVVSRLAWTFFLVILSVFAGVILLVSLVALPLLRDFQNAWNGRQAGLRFEEFRHIKFQQRGGKKE
ncbi:MAG TPA: hypothetical protein P5560_05990 [Thermotogota bacterium]|nr:hypothetical protein [Thermotogota bacterium]